MIRFVLLFGLLLLAGCHENEGERAQLNQLDYEIGLTEERLFGGKHDGKITLERLYARQSAIEAKLQADEAASRWPVKIPTKLNGQSIDICVYPESLNDGGFVVNVHTEQDKLQPDGTCWGTVIYPGRAVEQKPLPAK